MLMTSDTNDAHAGGDTRCPHVTFVHAYGTNRSTRDFIVYNCHEGDLTCASPESYDRPVWRGTAR